MGRHGRQSVLSVRPLDAAADEGGCDLRAGPPSFVNMRVLVDMLDDAGGTILLILDVGFMDDLKRFPRRTVAGFKIRGWVVKRGLMVLDLGNLDLVVGDVLSVADSVRRFRGILGSAVSGDLWTNPTMGSVGDFTSRRTQRNSLDGGANCLESHWLDAVDIGGVNATAPVWKRGGRGVVLGRLGRVDGLGKVGHVVQVDVVVISPSFLAAEADSHFAQPFIEVKESPLRVLLAPGGYPLAGSIPSSSPGP